jgi:hypothetical protein
MTKPSKKKYAAIYFDEIVFEHRIRLILRNAAPSAEVRQRLGYRRPTSADLKAYNQNVKTRYPLMAELTEAQQQSFIWEVKRYQRALASGKPAPAS